MKKLSKKRLDKWLKSLDEIRGAFKPAWIFRPGFYRDQTVFGIAITIKYYGCTRDRDFSSFKGVCIECFNWYVEIGRGI
jgi:hypothetical protein